MGQNWTLWSGCSSSKTFIFFLIFNNFCCLDQIYRVEITFEVGVQKSKQLTGPNHHHTPKVFQSKVLPVASEIKSYVRHMSPSTEIQIQKYTFASETHVTKYRNEELHKKLNPILPIVPRERTASNAANMMMMFPKNSSLTFLINHFTHFYVISFLSRKFNFCICFFLFANFTESHRLAT